MATAPNKYAIREAGIATFFNIANDGSRGKALFEMNTLKMGEVETSGETVYARGGRGNAKLVGFSSDKEARITLEDALISNDVMAALTGNNVMTSTKTVMKSKVGVLNSSKQLTLDHTGSITQVNIVGMDGALGVEIPLNATNGYQVADRVLTFNGAIEGITLEAGVRVRVAYTYAAAGAKTVRVTSDAFGKTFYLTVDVLVRDAVSQKDYFGQFVAPRAKIEDNFSFSFSPDGDPTVINMPIEILQVPGSADMWELVIYDAPIET